MKLHSLEWLDISVAQKHSDGCTSRTIFKETDGQICLKSGVAPEVREPESEQNMTRSRGPFICQSEYYVAKLDQLCNSAFPYDVSIYMYFLCEHHVYLWSSNVIQ